MSFTQGVSGLNAASSQLDTIGNNIANSQTVGFKSSRTEFADIYAGAKAGLGVQVSGITQGFSRGSLETTSRDLDLAIDGGGFFRLNDGQQITYSRNGQFQMDDEGFLVNGTGAQLTGYPVNDPEAADPVVLAGAEPQALQVPQGDLQANATTSGSMTFNLDSNSEVPAVAFPGDQAQGFDLGNPDPESFNDQSSLTVYDSQGNAQQVNLYFNKNADNDWTVNAINGGEQVGTTNLTFDANGQVEGGDNLALDFNPGTGANPIAANINLSSATQNSNEFIVKASSQDGYAAGSLIGLSIADNGDVVGNYSNDRSRALGRIALADFANEQGLQPNGNNGWLATGNSGPELLGSAGVGQLGPLRSGTLEQSNVDLAGELVSMIVSQRNYQANAQTIKTQDQILQTVVTLR